MAYKGVKAPSSEEVAVVLYRNLFERGEVRLSSQAAYVAKQMLTAGLREWKGQLLKEADDRLVHERTKADQWRGEARELRLRLAIALKEK